MKYRLKKLHYYSGKLFRFLLTCLSAYLVTLLSAYAANTAAIGDLIINEVMFKEASDNQEWIELYNRGDRVIELDDFYFLDAAKRRTLFSGTIDPKQYLVICRHKDRLLDYYPHLDDYSVIESTSWAVLRNDKETIWLIDNEENVLDSLSYNVPASFPRDVSLERINPYLPSETQNWGQSIDVSGATPGLQNSIYTEFIPEQTTMQIAPNPFSPTRGERTIISFEFPERLNRVTCRIFDLKGRLVNTLINQQIQASAGTIIWDGYRDNGDRLPIGVYIINLEAAGFDSERVFRARKTVVIAK